MGAPAKLRILLAEDHRLVREGLRRLLEDQPDCEIVAEATDGVEAIDLCGEVSPTIALIDLSMPRLDGIKVIEMLRTRCPEVRLIALTRHDDPSFVARAVSSGATGYVLKQSASTELLSAIRAVAAGRSYVDAAIHMPVAMSRPSRSQSTATADVTLSDSEEQVLRLFAAGWSNQEIATRLSCGAEEVAAQRGTAMRKLGLATRVEVLRFVAERHGL